MSRLQLLFALSIALAACNPKEAPARHKAPAVSAVHLTSAVPPASSNAAMYVYSPVGKRDPFQGEPGPRRKPPPKEIQKWSVDQFNLKFTVTGTASPKAVLASPDNRAWLVGIGTYVGNNWGKVTAIERDGVVVTESIEGPGGVVYPHPIKLLLPAPGNAEPERRMIDVPSEE